MKNASRLSYMDGIKGIAMLLVFSTHFIDFWSWEYLYYWNSFLLKGITGKLGVAMFGVVLGYFSRKNRRPVDKAILSRYIYFAVCGILVNLLYVLAGKLGLQPCGASFMNAVLSGFRLDSNIFQTFWCMKAFLIASVISYLNAHTGAGIRTVLLEMAFLYLYSNDVWVPICLLGNIAYLLCEEDCGKIRQILCDYRVALAFTVLFLLLAKRPDSPLKYFIDGLFSMSLIILLKNLIPLQKIFGCRVLALLGQHGMAFFLLHVLTYQILGKVLFQLITVFPYSITFLIVWLICLVFCFCLSIPFDYFLKKISHWLNNAVISAEEKLYHLSNLRERG